MKETSRNAAQRSMPATRGYGLGALCLVLGLVAGYLARASRAPASSSAKTVASAPASLNKGHAPSLEELKQMADRQAAPLLEKLKADPNNSALLVQIGALYHATHQFTAAAAYYGRAEQADPSDVSVRTKYAASLYRAGDVDSALDQLNAALHLSPNDANTLFNLGLIRWEAKHDARGALAAWQQLLKSDSQLSDDRKATVQHLITEVQASQASLPQSKRSRQP